MRSQVGKSSSGIAQFYWTTPRNARSGRWALTFGCGAAKAKVAEGRYTQTARGSIRVTDAAKHANANLAGRIRFAAIGSAPVPPTGLGAGGACPAYSDTTPIIAAGSWLSGKGVAVYPNGSTNGYCYNLTNKWQCVELINRLITTLGWSPAIGGNANQIYGNASTTYFDKHPNGSGYLPVQGDIVVWGGGIGGYGHVAVVQADTGGLVTVVEQNASANGYGVYPISSTGTIADSSGGYYVEGFLHAKANTSGTAGGSSTGVVTTSGVNPSGSFQFVSWVDSSNSLRLSHWTGSAWQNDNFGLAVDPNTSPSAFLGANGSHSIAWADSSGTLRFSHWTGTAWQNDNFGIGIEPGSSPSAFVGPNGNPFIAFADNTATLHLLHWTGTTWQNDNFGQAVRPGTSPSAYLGANGTIWIAWVDGAGVLRLSHWTGTSWQHDNFGTVVAAGSSPSAFNGPGNNPFIAWVDNGGTLRLNHWTGAAWQADNFGMGVAAGSSPSAYIGANGAIYIAWADNTNALRFSHWTGTTWQHDTLGSAVRSGSSPSAYLGANGTHFVSWVDSNGSLRLNHWTGTTWQADNFGAAVASNSSPSAYLG